MGSKKRACIGLRRYFGAEKVPILASAMARSAKLTGLEIDSATGGFSILMNDY